MIDNAHLATLKAMPLEMRVAHFTRLREKYKLTPQRSEALEKLLTQIDHPAFNPALLAAPQPFSPFKGLISLALLSFKNEMTLEKKNRMWAFIEPLLNVLFIFILASFLHAPVIYDMPTFPFAVIGVTTWLIFRGVFNALLHLNRHVYHQQDHYILPPLLLLLSGLLKPLVIQIILGFALLSLSVWLELAPWPHSLFKLVCLWGIVSLLGVGAGLLIRALTTRLKALQRMTGLLLRVLSLASGLFYVSEQLPQDISQILLLNPLLHAVQLAREAWFENYVSQDASFFYIILWLLPLLMAGLMSGFLTRKQIP